MYNNFKKNYPLYDSVEMHDFKDFILKNAEKNPNKIAFRFTENKEDKTVTYKEHLDNMYGLGTAIISIGYHDAHIAMVGDNCYEWALTQITVLGSDNALVPVDKELPFADLLNVINHSEAKVVFCTGSFAKCLFDNKDQIPGVEHIICYRPKDELPDGVIDGKEFIEKGKKCVLDGDKSYIDLKPDENALGELVYTSGTTGAPKGVMLSKHNLLSSVYYGMMSMKVFDVGLSVLPYNHTYESTCGVLVAQKNGSTLCINENLRTVADNFKKYKPNYVYLVPLFVETFYKKIMKTLEKSGQKEKVFNAIKISNRLRRIGIDLRAKLFKELRDVFGGNLEMIVCGGAPIRPDLAYFFDGIGIILINGYGITECSPLLSVNRLQYNDYRSVGVLLPCVSVRIDDPNEDGEGEIVVKGDIVMMGYYKNEEATKEVLTEDGWFATGDYGKMVGDRLYITGRKKNLIVLKNGKNVYPEEIEDYVGTIPGIEEHIVYGIKDENGDEIGLCAEIYPNPEFAKDKSNEDLESYFKKSCIEACKPLPAYKNINSVVIRHEEFPKTTTKKIKRQEVLKNR